MARLPAVGLVLAMLSSPFPLQAKNGFRLMDATIPIHEIHQGGPPRDGIPSIDEPKFEKAAEADWMRDGDLIVAVGVGDNHRAYPLRILVWHEIVNDTYESTLSRPWPTRTHPNR